MLRLSFRLKSMGAANPHAAGGTRIPLFSLPCSTAGPLVGPNRAAVRTCARGKADTARKDRPCQSRTEGADEETRGGNRRRNGEAATSQAGLAPKSYLSLAM